MEQSVGWFPGNPRWIFGDAEQHPRPPRARSELRVARRARPTSPAMFTYLYSRSRCGVWSQSPNGWRYTRQQVRGSRPASIAEKKSRSVEVRSSADPAICCYPRAPRCGVEDGWQGGSDLSARCGRRDGLRGVKRDGPETRQSAHVVFLFFFLLSFLPILFSSLLGLNLNLNFEVKLVLH
jgi:hypothetical protein